eukprot:210687-Amphidinium_carterae.1
MEMLVQAWNSCVTTSMATPQDHLKRLLSLTSPSGLSGAPPQSSLHAEASGQSNPHLSQSHCTASSQA